MLIGENELSIKIGNQVVCKRNETGVYISRGGLLAKYYLEDVSGASILTGPQYDQLIPGNKTEIAAKIGWALGPIGVGIGAAIGGMLDDKDKKSGAAIQLIYDGGKRLDLVCTSKELIYINDKILSSFGASINIESEKIAEEESGSRLQVGTGTTDEEQDIFESGEHKDLHSELIKLDDLRTKGIISDQEFTALKTRLLDSYGN